MHLLFTVSIYLQIVLLLIFIYLFLKVHHLKSLDNLFVVVKEYDNYQFKDTKVCAIFY